jgi:hypothetical protein
VAPAWGFCSDAKRAWRAELSRPPTMLARSAPGAGCGCAGKTAC